MDFFTNLTKTKGEIEGMNKYKDHEKKLCHAIAKNDLSEVKTQDSHISSIFNWSEKYNIPKNIQEKYQNSLRNEEQRNSGKYTICKKYTAQIEKEKQNEQKMEEKRKQQEIEDKKREQQFLIDSAKSRKFMDEFKEKKSEPQYNPEKHAIRKQISKDREIQRGKRNLYARGPGESCPVPLRCAIIMVFLILIIILFIYLMSPCDMNNGQPIMFAQKGRQTCDC